MTVRINKQKINLREKLTEFEDKVNFDEVVRGLGEYAGNVGIGTTNPLCKFHVRNGDESALTIDGSTAYESARFTSTSGGRNISLLSSAATLSSYIGSLDSNHSLRFFTTKMSDSSRNTHMTITEGGNVGIGTTNPGSARLAINHTSSDRIIVTRSFSTDSQYHHLFQNSSGTTVGNILVSTTGTSYVQNSDYRLKENVVPIDDAISRVKQLKPSRFNFIIDADNTVDGFLAHEVQEVVPQAITGEKDAVNADGDPEYQGIDQSKLVPLLTAAIQEQQSIIEDLKSRIETLESK